jgi:MFS family permease
VLSGRVAQLVGLKAQLVGASLVGVVGCALLALFHSGVAPIAAAGALLGVAFGLAYAALASLVVQAVPPSQTGAASGMSTNIRTIGGALGTAVVSSVVTASAGPTGLPTEAGFTDAFWVLAGASLVAALLALLVPATRRRPSLAPEPEAVAVVAPVPAGSR